MQNYRLTRLTPQGAQLRNARIAGEERRSVREDSWILCLMRQMVEDGGWLIVWEGEDHSACNNQNEGDTWGRGGMACLFGVGEMWKSNEQNQLVL